MKTITQNRSTRSWQVVLCSSLATLLFASACGEGDRPAPGPAQPGPARPADDPTVTPAPIPPTTEPDPTCAPLPGGASARCSVDLDCPQNQDQLYVCDDGCCLPRPPTPACAALGDDRQGCEAAGCAFRECPPNADCQETTWCEERSSCEPLPDGRDAGCYTEYDCPTNYDQFFTCQDGCCVPGVPADPTRCESMADASSCQGAGCTWEECPPTALCDVAGWCTSPGATCENLDSEEACAARSDCQVQFSEICDCTCSGERGCEQCPAQCFPFNGCAAR